MKSKNLLEVAIFEFETIYYPDDQFYWKWNKNGNLEGFTKGIDRHTFTWQPHGSRFSIIEDVPENRLALKIKNPPVLNHDQVLDSIKFDSSWITII